MIALLVAHVVAAALAPTVIRLLGRHGFVLLALPPAATAVWAAAMTGRVRDGDGPVQHVEWVPALGMELSFRMDTLSWLLTLLVGAVGAIVLVYCAGYFDDAEPGLGRFAGFLTGFAGAMLGLVTSDDMLVLYLFWELTTVLSYLLVGHLSEKRASRTAAMKALVVTTFGGLAMLVGIILLGQSTGTYRLSQVLETAPDGTLVTVAVGLLLLGAITKSALVPFHFWLPGAMAAPTPVSAYLHAAAMVKAGIYLVARLAPTFADNPLWRPTVLVLGGVTMVLGGWRALRQTDLKLLLAYGTVSQLGFLTVLVGTGTRDAALAGLTLLVAHALFKACLFLVVGIVDHSTGTRDIRELSGVGRQMPVVAVTATLAAASMAGLPPLLGFVGKEVAYAGYLYTQSALSGITLAVLVAGSVLTFAYSTRFLLGAFATEKDKPRSDVDHPGLYLLAGPVLLAAAGLVAGPASARVEPLLLAYASSWPADDNPVHLGLWHGFGLPLALSAITVALGSALYLGRRRLEAWQRSAPTMMEADDAYRATMRGLDRLALEVTGFFQRGSLPLSLGLILLVLVALPGTATLLWGTWPQEVHWGDSPSQIAVIVLIAVAAVWTARSRRRLRAAMLVGVTGYGTAMLFLLHGAPDLALTQLLVETVSLVVFVLVLRRLPSRFSDTPPGLGRWVRIALGTLVGASVTVMALIAAGARQEQPISVGMGEAAVEFGGGSNIVNVTLVDIRAWDTMGELSVVLVAATGVASLVFLRQRSIARVRAAIDQTRSQRSLHASVGGSSGFPWLVGDSIEGPERRSAIFEVVTRLAFHAIIVFSLYVLFAGHNNPGGGFAAGLIVGLALTIRYLAGGREELKAAAPVMPGWLLGSGLFLSAGYGLVSMVFGGAVLQSWTFDLHLPVLGEAHFVTSVFFDIGVYLVVIGLMLDVLRSLGGEVDVQIEREQNGRDRESAPEVTR